MSCMNTETADMWKQLAADAAAQRPIAGRRVRVTVGRKHLAKEGVVVRHIPDRYSDAFRYGNDASMHLREIQGRYGFVVQIRTDSGESFWTKAQNVEVVT